MKPTRLLALLLALLLATFSQLSVSEAQTEPSTPGSSATKQAVPRSSGKRRPKTGLVLAGGGALGMAHIGVLKVLEANRIPVDIITGTSMGSIVGAAYASGATVPEMETLLGNTDWDELFNEQNKRTDETYRNKYGVDGEILGSAKIGVSGGSIVDFAGVVSGQNVLPLLQTLYHRTPGEINFDELPIPYRAIAADIETGDPVVLKSGELARATRASMAVPGFFTPVELNGRMLVDGGIANNLPVDIALEMGAERLIVVDLSADFKKKDELTNVLAISGQIISLLLQQNSMLQRKLMRPGDVLLLPDLKGYSATDFKKAQEIFAKGEAAADEQLKQLRRFSVSEAEYAKWQARREVEPAEVVITEVSVDTDLEELREPVEEAFAFQVGQPLDTEKVEDALHTTFEDGRVGKLEYEVIKEPDGGSKLHLIAKKPKWYDEYFRVGLALQDDFDGNSYYQIALAGRFNDLNAWGGYLNTRLEIGWRPLVDIDFYQPLGANSPYFVNPNLLLDRYQLPVTIENEVVAQYERSRLIGALAFGRNFFRDGELSGGLSRGMGRLERTIGSPALQNQDYEIGNFYGRVAWDSLDTPDFPRSGVQANFVTFRNVGALGSSEVFTQMTGTGNLPITFGHNTLLLSSDFGTNPENVEPERYFVLGGMFDLSGYQPAGLAASDFVIGRTTYYRQLESLGGSFAKLDVFAGGSFQMASLKSDLAQIPDNSDIAAGLLFVGADTPLFPVYFGFGLNNQNEQAVYLNLGRIFNPRQY